MARRRPRGSVRRVSSNADTASLFDRLWGSAFGCKALGNDGRGQCVCHTAPSKWAVAPFILGRDVPFPILIVILQNLVNNG